MLLPPELWDSIIDFIVADTLRDSGSAPNKALLRCSKVCRQWRSKCSPFVVDGVHLVEHGHPAPPISYAQRGYELLRNSPPSLRHWSTLRNPRKVYIHPSSDKLSDPNFTFFALEFLSLLEQGRLETLHLHQVNLSFTSMTYTFKGLQSPRNFIPSSIPGGFGPRTSVGLEAVLPTLKHLILDVMTFSTLDDLHGLLRASPCLESLKLVKVYWRIIPGNKGHPAALKLDHLHHSDTVPRFRQLTLGRGRPDILQDVVLRPDVCDLSAVSEIDTGSFAFEQRDLDLLMDRIGGTLRKFSWTLGTYKVTVPSLASCQAIETMVFRLMDAATWDLLEQSLLRSPSIRTLRFFTLVIMPAFKGDFPWEQFDRTLSNTRVFPSLQLVTVAYRIQSDSQKEDSGSEGKLRSTAEEVKTQMVNLDVSNRLEIEVESIPRDNTIRDYKCDCIIM